jgi:ATP-binding cassette subfamily F protein uup
MLGDYPGTILLISHDRDFLDRVVNAVIVPEGGGRWIEYAGGYTDMLTQRGADIAGRAVDAPRPKAAKQAAVVQPSRTERKRLSFNQQHALKTLPGRIARLEASIGALQEKLGDPQLYARDPKAFAELSAALAKAQADLDAAEAEWLELELLREATEGG